MLEYDAQYLLDLVEYEIIPGTNRYWPRDIGIVSYAKCLSAYNVVTGEFYHILPTKIYIKG